LTRKHAPEPCYLTTFDEQRFIQLTRDGDYDAFNRLVAEYQSSGASKPRSSDPSNATDASPSAPATAQAKHSSQHAPSYGGS
jgi:hypothetical protein